MPCTCTLATFLSNCPHALLFEIHKGAYVMLKDHQRLYNKLLLDKCGQTSILSSHVSETRQYRCNDMFTPLIYGVKNGCTWFTFERHRPENPMHCIDYCMYKCMNRNIGKDGTSAYTEANPLVLDKTTSIKLIL